MSPDRLAIANTAVLKTFEQASVAWQAVPHWMTGDPGQANVSNDLRSTIAGPNTPPFTPSGIALGKEVVPFRITLAQATAPTPDALLAAAMAQAVVLAQQVDEVVLAALINAAVTAAAGPWFPPLAAPAVPPVLPAPSNLPAYVAALIDGRVTLEDSGYRAASCLVASRNYFVNINQWTGETVATGGLLAAGGVDSLFRTSHFPAAPANLMIMLGRARQIPYGCACDASSGEEPVDLAVSVPPSLEVVGDNGGNVELAVRIRFVTRVKDERGIVVFHDP